jgi:hypothetical protein
MPLFDNKDKRDEKGILFADWRKWRG